MTANQINSELDGMYEQNDRLMREVDCKLKDRELIGIKTMTGLPLKSTAVRGFGNTAQSSQGKTVTTFEQKSTSRGKPSKKLMSTLSKAL